MSGFLFQAVAVALVVTALLALTRRGGTLLAGMATAALSAPTLVLLATQEGVDFALHAAVGSLLSTPLCAGLAALGLGWLARGAAPGAPALPGPAWSSALMAGLFSAAVCAGAREFGALASGFIGGLPVVAAWTTLGVRRHSGSAVAARYLRAYRRGLWLRAVMTLTFATAVLPLGAIGSMALALGVSGFAVFVSTFRRTR